MNRESCKHPLMRYGVCAGQGVRVAATRQLVRFQLTTCVGRRLSAEACHRQASVSFGFMYGLLPSDNPVERPEPSHCYFA